jgi:hypothetical protein
MAQTGWELVAKKKPADAGIHVSKTRGTINPFGA